MGEKSNGNTVNEQRLRPGAATNKTYVLIYNWGNYRRTATGYGRTKKPGLHGTVKNPRLLKACMIISVISCMGEFFDIFSSESKKSVKFRLRGKETELFPCFAPFS